MDGEAVVAAPLLVTKTAVSAVATVTRCPAREITGAALEYAGWVRWPAMDFGCRTMTEALRRVLVRRPSVPACALWREFGWRGEPEPNRLLAEHDAFSALLESAGAEVFVAEPLDTNPDAVYAFDPGFVTERGAILLRPGKEGRRGEPGAAAQALELAGVP